MNAIKRVCLTRSKEDIQKDRQIFEREGFQVIELPLIQEKLLDFEVPQTDFDFVVFQSPRAVRAFLSRYKLRDEKVVAVGERTKKEVESYGYSVWAMPENYYGSELLKLFSGMKGKVLVPRSAIGRDEVVEGLKAMGFEVYPLDVYTVEPVFYPKEEVMEKLSMAQAVLFASPSAVDALLANLQKQDALKALEALWVVCIGRTTKQFFESRFPLKCLMPEKPSVEKVVELLKNLA